MRTSPRSSCNAVSMATPASPTRISATTRPLQARLVVNSLSGCQHLSSADQVCGIPVRRWAGPERCSDQSASLQLHKGYYNDTFTLRAMLKPWSSRWLRQRTAASQVRGMRHRQPVRVSTTKPPRTRAPSAISIRLAHLSGDDARATVGNGARRTTAGGSCRRRPVPTSEQIESSEYAADASLRPKLSVTYALPPPPNTAPSVALTSPASGASIVLGESLAIAAIASDTDGVVRKVAFSPGRRSSVKSRHRPTPSTGRRFKSVPTRSPRSPSTTVQQRTASSAVPVDVVGPPPPPPPPNVPPSVSLIAPAGGEIIVLGDAVALTASASDSDGVVAKVEFYAGTTSLARSRRRPTR